VKRHHFRRTAAAIGAAGALIVLGACGSGSSSGSTPAVSQPSSSAGTSSAKVTITIKDFKYSGPSSVKPGATVMVMNEDSMAHTVTADDSSGGFDVKVDANSMATFTAPSKAGDYAYHCTFHSNMHGTLTVG
jgi:plastocyanin